MRGIAEWLASIGVGEYAQRFADNAIDLSVIRDLTEQDLKDLGVLLGHRRKILRAIAELDGVAPASIEPAVSDDEAERRHLTVMICDLVGSTALSTRLDPEDTRAVIDAYHAACARITRTYDGFLAEFRGDGILVYFGYPIAHEDDAERTVRAGLDIIAAVWAERGKNGKRGKPLTPMKLAQMLKPLAIAPDHLGSGTSVRGYKLWQLEEAFSRYLPPEQGLSSRRVQELAEWCSHQAYWHYSKNALDAGALDADLREILRKEVPPWHVEIELERVLTSSRLSAFPIERGRFPT